MFAIPMNAWYVKKPRRPDCFFQGFALATDFEELEMDKKKAARLRRAKKTRSHIRRLGMPRLSVHRSGCHIYAQVISADGGNVIAAASTLQKDVKAVDMRPWVHAKKASFILLILVLSIYIMFADLSVL